MKPHSFLVALSLALHAIASSAADVPAEAGEVSLSLSLEGTSALLRWSGGIPNYQVQTRSSLDGPWRNLGEPTTARSMTLPLGERAAFFRVVPDYTARFEVIFDATWSQTTHPGAWPPNPHWSAPVGGVHNDRVRFWGEGEPATEGIRLMAERGQQAPLAAEIQAAIPGGDALFTFTASGLPSPGQRVISLPRATTRDFTRLTLCSMIAPSPDWFVGVAGLSLVDSDGRWIPEQTVTLYGFDAGTDSGADFTSPDLVTSPRGVITRFSGYPALMGGRIVPFGTFQVRRVPE